ncbi:MAG: hypothetical protein C4570_00210 [Ammonifex sp.]|nr:MAG: hypothetical protein C4570_00210 [Ammonifex sp.]
MPSETIHLYLVIFLLATGLRRNEALSLRWKDVNFERGILPLTKQLKRNRRGQLWPRKNKN